jgi:hypothetical protein
MMMPGYAPGGYAMPNGMGYPTGVPSYYPGLAGYVPANGIGQ